ncbi:MAG: DNA-binding protein [Euryarchaeota archaeon]|nr:DNA-binding protein [Euryarchaeota archaeon]
MSTTVSIRLSDDIAHELEGLAMTIKSSGTYTIHKAIESYLQEYDNYSAALERLNYEDTEIISSDEMGNCLAL